MPTTWPGPGLAPPPAPPRLVPERGLRRARRGARVPARAGARRRRTPGRPGLGTGAGSETWDRRLPETSWLAEERDAAARMLAGALRMLDVDLADLTYYGTIGHHGHLEFPASASTEP
ncbi:hypothetical protein GCM10010182_02140 [Actinomadura cremea]|nr:hypothetical protein GCM10010182_02140 [Actinomadura cremea]